MENKKMLNFFSAHRALNLLKYNRIIVWL